MLSSYKHFEALCQVFRSNIHRNVCRREIPEFRFPAVVSHSSNIKPNLHVFSQKPLLGSQISSGGSGDITLFRWRYGILRLALHGCRPSLHLYKMYSITSQRNEVDFKMSAPPVPVQNRMSVFYKVLADLILSNPPQCAFSLRFHTTICQMSPP